MRIHQILSSAGRYDAITQQAVMFNELFASWGMAGDIHASAIGPRLPEPVHGLELLRPRPEDILLIHYSAYASRLEPLLDLPNRKMLVYHNVTPARYLWSFEPHVAALCQIGRDHLPRYARAVDIAVAVSEYNAAELREAGARDVRVVPILFEPKRFGRPEGEPDLARPLVINVGRLAPHKRHDLVIRAFALFQREVASEARLVCAGEPISPRYGDDLARLVERLGVRGVELPGALDQKRLTRLYTEAAVALYLSEHEGFCIPLLEAFQFRIPVVARPVGGMGEVAGDAILRTDETPDLAVVAELLGLSIRDEELRDTLAARGGARLDGFSRERTEAKLRDALAAVGV